MEWKKIERKVHNFEEQPELVGKLVAKQQGHFGSNDYVLETNENETVVVYGKTALNSKLDGVESGTWVKIVYLGEKTSNDKRKYQDFDVFVNKEESIVEENKEGE